MQFKCSILLDQVTHMKVTYHVKCDPVWIFKQSCHIEDIMRRVNLGCTKLTSLTAYVRNARPATDLCFDANPSGISTANSKSHCYINTTRSSVCCPAVFIRSFRLKTSPASRPPHPPPPVAEMKVMTGLFFFPSPRSHYLNAEHRLMTN